MKYFRCDAGDAAYEQARLALDAAWGHPIPEKKITTCIAPAAIAPRDSMLRIVLAVNDEFCDYPAAAQMLSIMLGSGAAEEISSTDYDAAANKPPR